MTRLIAEQNVILSIMQDRICPFLGALACKDYKIRLKGSSICITVHNFAAIIRIKNR